MKRKKRLIGGLLAVAGCMAIWGNSPCAVCAAETSVAIEEYNFPDVLFRQYVSDNFDTDNTKGVLSTQEIENAKKMIIENLDIYSLQGIELFPQLEIVSISGTSSLESVDFSANTAITSIRIEDAPLLNSINYSNCANLETVWLKNTNLTSLSFCDFSKLCKLNLDNNKLEDLSVKDCPKLEELNGNDNVLTSLIVENVGEAALEIVCCNNQLTDLSVNCEASVVVINVLNNKLSSIDLSNIPGLSSLNCSNNDLKTIDLSHNGRLSRLSISNNKIENLDLSQNVNLFGIYCDSNNLTELDTSNCSSLYYINCEDNKIKTLDFSANSVLYSVYCSNNELTSLNVSSNTLKDLDCHGNRLTSLDIKNSCNMWTLDCSDNQLTYLDITEKQYLVNPKITGNNMLFVYADYFLRGDSESLQSTYHMHASVADDNTYFFAVPESQIGFDGSKISNLTEGVRIEDNIFYIDKGCTKFSYDYECAYTLNMHVDVSVFVPGDDCTVLEEADCSKEGKIKYTCSGCGEGLSLSTLKTDNHIWDEGRIEKKPTCVSEGTTVFTCTRCEKERTEAISVSTTHTWEESNIEQATCDKEGVVKYSCIFCGSVYHESIPKVSNHEWTEKKVIFEATCWREGVKSSTCTICGKSEDEAIPKTNHTYDEGVVSVEPTYEMVGIKTYTCTVCGETKTENIDKLVKPADEDKKDEDQKPGDNKPSNNNDSVPENNSRALIESFVARMFTKALGRNYDANGLKYWSDRLETHIDDGANVAYGFFNSNEFLKKDMDNATYINILYATFFGRDADKAGFDYWNGELTGGTSRNKVLCGFISSNEFKKLCSDAGINRGFTLDDGTVANAGIYNFVERMYTKCLGRDGEEGGMNWWTLEIANKTQTPVDAAKSFFGSNEFVNKKLGEEDYIKTLYRTFMDREADASGLAYWKGEMAGGMTRDRVLDGFAASNEFKNILEGFGL